MNLDELANNIDLLKSLNKLMNDDKEITNSKRAHPNWNGEKVMIFLYSGFIFVGDLYKESNQYVLKNPLNCRYQEKGNGWGYIAEQGKDSCQVDSYGGQPLCLFEKSILMIRQVDKNVW